MRIPDVHGAIDVPASTPPLDVQEFVDSKIMKDFPIYGKSNSCSKPPTR